MPLPSDCEQYTYGTRQLLGQPTTRYRESGFFLRCSGCAPTTTTAQPRLTFRCRRTFSQQDTSVCLALACYRRREPPSNRVHRANSVTLCPVAVILAQHCEHRAVRHTAIIKFVFRFSFHCEDALNTTRVQRAAHHTRTAQSLRHCRMTIVLCGRRRDDIDVGRPAFPLSHPRPCPCRLVPPSCRQQCSSPASRRNAAKSIPRFDVGVPPVARATTHTDARACTAHTQR